MNTCYLEGVESF